MSFDYYFVQTVTAVRLPMIIATRDYYAEELAEALEYKLAQEGVGDAPASYSPDPEEIDRAIGDEK